MLTSIKIFTYYSKFKAESKGFEKDNVIKVKKLTPSSIP